MAMVWILAMHYRNCKATALFSAIHVFLKQWPQWWKRRFVYLWLIATVKAAFDFRNNQDSQLTNSAIRWLSFRKCFCHSPRYVGSISEAELDSLLQQVGLPSMLNFAFYAWPKAQGKNQQSPTCWHRMLWRQVSWHSAKKHCQILQCPKLGVKVIVWYFFHWSAWMTTLQSFEIGSSMRSI